MEYAARLLFMLALACSVNCMESVYMKRSEVADQESSASGFAYQVHSGGPLTYASYPAPLGGLNHVGYGPVGLARLTTTQELPPITAHLKPQIQQLPLQLPIAQEFKPREALTSVPINSYGLQAFPAATGFHTVNLPFRKLSPAPVAASVSDVSNYVKGGGASYSDANQASHGEKGSTGYKTAHEYDKGAKGEHDKSGHKEHYSKEGGSKSGEQEEGAHYGQKEEAAKGAEGASFSQSSKHKKGSKTTGFHKVHHKDEYKKDHSFYDEADNRGHYQKHGKFNAHHSAEKGGFQKGGQEKAAYDAAQHGTKGFTDKGKHVDQDSGFKGAEGKEAYHKDFQEYAKKGGEEQGKEEGFVKKEALEDED